MKRHYGYCPRCMGELRPQWFKEQEFVKGHPTGRTRLAVSVLVCESCLERVNVDDSYDYPWGRYADVNRKAD